MRVGVAITFATLFGIAAADQASFQAGISQVVEALGQVTLDRNSQASGLAAGRKIFVEHLLGEVANAPSTGDAKTNLELISAILHNISVMIGADRDGDDQLLTDARKEFVDCPNSTAVSEETELTTDKNDALGAHTTCRQAEDGLAESADTSCTTARNEIHSFLNGDAKKPVFETCSDWADNNFPVPDAAWDLATFQNWFYSNPGSAHWTNMRNFLSGRKSAFNDFDTKTAGGNCKTNFDNWEAKNGCPAHSNGACTGGADSCSNKQHLYELAFCSYQYIVNRKCSDLAACYSREQVDFNEERTTVFDNAELRLRDVAVVLYVKCFIDELNADKDATTSTINATCGSFLDISSTTIQNYNNSNTIVLPAPEDCSNETAVDENLAKFTPSHITWLHKEYITGDPITGKNHKGDVVVGQITGKKNFIVNNLVSASC